MKKFPISPIFVPANKLDWIEKTYDKGADAVIIDLEDSVSNELKADARSNLVSFLKTKESDRTLLVRVNPIDQQTGLEDIKILSEISSKIDAFVLPKIESLEHLEVLPQVDLVPLIETPTALRNIAMLSSHERVVGIALGGADLSASLGSDMSWDSLLFARSQLLLEAAINNLFTIDSPFMDMDDLSGLEKESILSKRLGFTGKAAIHPNQIEVITNSFLPTERDIKEAKAIIKEFNSSPEAVIAYEGKMVDMPIVLSMEKRLKLVGIDPKNID